MRKGDAERGSLLMFITSRGQNVAILERMLSPDGVYHWQATKAAESPGSEDMVNFLARRARFDDDLWAIELDIADPERFIAETIHSG